MAYENNIPIRGKRAAIPLSAKELKSWKKAAREAGMTLAEHVRRVMNEHNSKPTNGEKLDA